MSATVKTQVDERWTVDDSENVPVDDGNRYAIIDGSPLLPDFAVTVGDFFADIPQGE